MLSNSRVLDNSLRGVVCLAGTVKVSAVMKKIMVSDRPGNVLLNAFLQTLGCTTYVPNVTVAHKLFFDIVVVMGRLYILFGCGKKRPSCENNMCFNSKIATLNDCNNLFFKPG